MINDVCLWMFDPSIHNLPLAEGLCKIGYNVSVYVERDMLEQRRRLGWENEGGKYPIVKMLNRTHAKKLLIDKKNAHHLFYGIHAYKYICFVSKMAQRLNLSYGFLQEMPDPRGIKGAFRKMKYRWLAKSVNVPYMLTPGGYEYFSKCGFDPQRMYRFCYPSDALPLSASNMKSKKVKIAYVGVFEPRKNIFSMIDALGKIDSCLYEVSFLGEGSLLDKMKSSCSRQNIPATYLSPMSPYQVKKFLQMQDVLVLPSLHDGYGMVVNEALLAGCRVIVSDACGASDIARSFSQAIIFNNSKRNELENCIHLFVELGQINDRERLKNVSACYQLESKNLVDRFVSIMDGSLTVERHEKTFPVCSGFLD